MVARSWILRAMPTSKSKVEKWLKDEATNSYVLADETDKIKVSFVSIDDAFRFRMQFDEELLD